jgi:hypothetical protein
MSKKQKQIDMVKDLLDAYPEAEWSFAHSVLSDGNLRYSDIENCLKPDRVMEWVQSQYDTMDKRHPFGVTVDMQELFTMTSAILKCLNEMMRICESNYVQNP